MSKGKHDQVDMLHGPLLGKLVLFALPLALSSILQQLFNAVDIAVLGQFAPSQDQAAVGCTSAVINMFLNLFLGISVGANVVIANAIGCRDDIMLYLIKCGMPEKRSFKIMEAVRKGRGLPEGAEEEMKAAGVPEWYIGSCKKIKYLFPKAHATAYVMMAFRIAWFKVHQPLAFYAAYFYRRSQKGGFDEGMMCHGIELVKKKLQEIKADEDSTAKDDDLFTTLEVCYEFYRRGFHFDTIDIYRSDATKFTVTEGGLLPPFISVHGLGEAAALDTVEKRRGKEFISVEEFSMCCNKLSKTHIEQLRALGAFAGMADTSQLTLFG